MIIEIHEKLIKNDVVVGVGVVVVVVAFVVVVIVAPFVIILFWFNSASNKDTFGDILSILCLVVCPLSTNVLRCHLGNISGFHIQNRLK